MILNLKVSQDCKANMTILTLVIQHNRRAKIQVVFLIAAITVSELFGFLWTPKVFDKCFVAVVSDKV